MPYGDKSSATEIQERFNMSKSAFKRALGTLYKNEQIDLEGNQTTLRKEVE
jgi:predicted RNA-binding protein (virulence factor B family)